jgi:hypothetical protein
MSARPHPGRAAVLAVTDRAAGALVEATLGTERPGRD